MAQQIIPKDYEEVKQILDNVIQNLPKLKDELINNKDDIKKLNEIADKLENLQADLIAVKGFILAQIYLNSEYNDD